MLNNLSVYTSLAKAGAFIHGGIIGFEAAIVPNVIDDILTLGIQTVEHGKCTHIGIVPPLSQFTGGPDILLCESTIITNTLTGKTVNGPQINNLRLRLAGYAGRAWLCGFTPDVAALDWSKAYGVIGQKFGKDHYAVKNLFLDLGHAIGLPVHASITNSEVCCEYALEWLWDAGLPHCPVPAGSTPETVLALPFAAKPQLIGDPAALR